MNNKIIVSRFIFIVLLIFILLWHPVPCRRCVCIASVPLSPGRVASTYNPSIPSLRLQYALLIARAPTVHVELCQANDRDGAWNQERVRGRLPPF